MEKTMVMSARQAAELDHAFERAGLTPEYVKKLSSGKTLEAVFAVLRGRSRIIPVVLPKVSLDGDKPPKSIGDDPCIFNQKMGTLTVERRGDALFINKKKVVLHVTPSQERLQVLHSDIIKQELAGKRVLNIAVHDFLMEHPEYIPDSWMNTSLEICFWGTEYKDPSGTGYVRYFNWNGHEYGWRENYHIFDGCWQERFVAAVIEE